MISAKWWNRKPYTFFSHWDTNSILHRQVPIVKPEVSQEALVPQVSMKPVASKQVLKFVALAKSFCLAHKPHSKGNCQLKTVPGEGKKKLKHSDSLRSCVTHVSSLYEPRSYRKASEGAQRAQTLACTSITLSCHCPSLWLSAESCPARSTHRPVNSERLEAAENNNRNQCLGFCWKPAALQTDRVRSEILQASGKVNWENLSDWTFTHRDSEKNNAQKRFEKPPDLQFGEDLLPMKLVYKDWEREPLPKMHEF